MAQLLIEHPLRRASTGDHLSTVARARTLTVLTRVDGARKRTVLQFLYESGLIYSTRPVLGLSGAYLRKANLRAANLREANLGVANLGVANLSGADLSGAKGITNEELVDQQAASLEGATMPNGQKYEEWLKDKKAQGKDEKN
jgi:hypothetical protein